MELLIVLGAIVLALLIFGWVFKLIKSTLQTLLLVGFLLLVLYFVFGIGPDVLWQQIQSWLEGNRGR